MKAWETQNRPDGEKTNHQLHNSAQGQSRNNNNNNTTIKDYSKQTATNGVFLPGHFSCTKHKIYKRHLGNHTSVFTYWHNFSCVIMIGGFFYILDMINNIIVITGPIYGMWYNDNVIVK